MEPDERVDQVPGQVQLSKERSQKSSETPKTDITCKTASKGILNGIRCAILSFLEPFTAIKIIVTICMLMVAFAKNVAGSVRLMSDCPLERQVAVYLFVKSSFAFLFWIGILAIGLSKRFVDTIPVHVAIVILKAFSLAWLIVGTVWVAKYSAMIEGCPIYVNDWKPHFIRFAIAWICLDWILGVIGLFYCLGVACLGNAADRKTGQSPSV